PRCSPRHRAWPARSRWDARVELRTVYVATFTTRRPLLGPPRRTIVLRRDPAEAHRRDRHPPLRRGRRSGRSLVAGRWPNSGFGMFAPACAGPRWAEYSVPPPVPWRGSCGGDAAALWRFDAPRWSHTERLAGYNPTGPIGP